MAPRLHRRARAAPESRLRTSDARLPSVARIRVIFENGDPERVIEFDPARAPFQHDGKPGSILDVLLGHGIHLEHACGGNCACTTCHVVVKDGNDAHLSDADDDEMDRVDMAADLTPHSRLGCQALVKGDVVVEIPAWNRNYISEGGSSILGDGIPPPKKPQTAAASPGESPAGD